MIGVVGRVRESVASARELILREIARIQRPVLDRKIDEMLRDARKIRGIAQKYAGTGLGVGRKLGPGLRRGGSLVKRPRRLSLG